MTTLAPDRLLARQPIFDVHHKVFGYELLVGEVDGGRASGSTGTAGLILGGFLDDVPRLVGERPAFVQVDAEMLIGGEVALLPPGQVVLELGTDLPPAAEVRGTLLRLHERGFRFALRDYVFDDQRAALLDLMDFVAVDFSVLDRQARRRLVARLGARKLSVIATRVESHMDAAEAFVLGCRYIQGFFFATPEQVTSPSLNAFRANHVQLLQASQREPLDLAEIEQVLKQDVQLSYQFLRYLNAAAFGWRTQISSISHGLVLLGNNGIRRWVGMVALANLVSGKPSELAVHACLRARFCELLAPLTGLPSLDLFLVGMFSLLDAILDRPLEEALDGLLVADEVVAALLGSEGPEARVLDLCIAYERADWTAVHAAATDLGIDIAALTGHYREAVDWAVSIFYQQAA